MVALPLCKDAVGIFRPGYQSIRLRNYINYSLTFYLSIYLCGCVSDKIDEVYRRFILIIHINQLRVQCFSAYRSANAWKLRSMVTRSIFKWVLCIDFLWKGGNSGLKRGILAILAGIVQKKRSTVKMREREREREREKLISSTSSSLALGWKLLFSQNFSQTGSRRNIENDMELVVWRIRVVFVHLLLKFGVHNILRSI